jgi:hypothetical protein
MVVSYVPTIHMHLPTSQPSALPTYPHTYLVTHLLSYDTYSLSMGSLCTSLSCKYEGLPKQNLGTSVVVHPQLSHMRILAHIT